MKRRGHIIFKRRQRKNKDVPDVWLHEIRMSSGMKNIAISAWQGKKDTDKGTKIDSRKQNNNIIWVVNTAKYALALLGKIIFQNI